MAYNCKYRLDFSDVAERKRRVEILKKDYGGSVLPMVGTGEPVIIEWKSDDDFYEPLIGSQCTLNLMVTDSVTYDNFYEYDEREYQVVVYFEDAPNSWAVYWKGWVTNDIYSEAITTAPYSFSINAIDGIGSLDGFDSWIPAVGDANPTLWQFIYKNLQNLELNFDFWISNDIRYYTEGSWNNVFDDVSIYKEGAFKDNYILHDCKSVLRSILMAFNCKMSQSYGRWVISNASSYGDQRVIAGIQNGTLSGAGILSAKQAYLNGGSEDIKFEVYNYLGAYVGSVTDNYLRIVPSYFKAINNNLTRLIKRPLRKYEEVINIKQKKIDLNYNASFEFDLENWTITGASTISADSFSGKKALRFTDYSPTLGTYATKAITTGADNVIEGNQYQLLISVNVDEGGSVTKLPYFIRLFFSGNYYYWDNVIKNWGTSGTILWSVLDLNADGTYESFKITPSAVPNSGTLEIGIAPPYLDAVGAYTATYIDNFCLRNIDNEQNNYEEAIAIREQLVVNKVSDIMRHEDVYVGNFNENVFWGSFINYPLFRRSQDNGPKTLEEIITQQRLNDFRSYCKTYEGDLNSNSPYMVISMMNKVYFNFSNFTETDSAIMDSMRFSVKSNAYSILCHIPNNYTDVSSNYRVSFQ